MKRTLVICDDDPMARKVIEMLAVQAGYEVVAEVDLAVRAVEMAAYHQPGVLVMDVSMPGMRGTEAVALAREASEDTRIILVSAFDLIPRGAVPGGAYDVVDKTDFGYLASVLASIPTIAAA
ncbi:MAG TPA: response regulator [Acidimicrobiales bacterium]|nr:response regulator [Acidimicrobiales bacterium]